MCGHFSVKKLANNFKSREKVSFERVLPIPRCSPQNSLGEAVFFSVFNAHMVVKLYTSLGIKKMMLKIRGGILKDF